MENPPAEKKKPTVPGVISIILAGMNAIGLLLSLGYSLYIRNRFMAIFEDFGAALPTVTQLIIRTHWSIWVLGTVLGLVILALKELIPKKWIPLLLNGIFLLFGIIYWAVFSTAMLFPLAEMVEQINPR